MKSKKLNFPAAIHSAPVFFKNSSTKVLRLKPLVFILIMLNAFSGIGAQNHEWAKWYRPINGDANDSWAIKDIKSDAQGNVYAKGTFQSPVSVGIDTLFPNYPTIPENGDIYLSKYSIDGVPIWTKVIGGYLYDFPRSLVVNDTAVFLAALVQGDSVRIGDTTYLNSEKRQVIRFDTDGPYRQTYFQTTTSSNNAYLNNLCAYSDALYIGSWHEITEFNNFPEIKKQTIFTTTSGYTEAISLLDNAVEQIRRISHNLAPPSLYSFDLIEAIQQYCSKVNTSNPVNITFQYFGNQMNLEKDKETAIYRVIQDC